MKHIILTAVFAVATLGICPVGYAADAADSKPAAEAKAVKLIIM